MSGQPIRVCFPFVGDGIGGSHISALKLVEGLDRRRIDPLIVLHQPEGALADYIRGLGLSFVSLPKLELLVPLARPGGSKNKLWSYFTETLPQLRRFLASNRLQIVHTNDGRVHVTWALAARLAGAKLVWHHRGSPDAKGVNYLAPILANHIVTVSRFSRPQNPVLPVAKRLSVVYSPFEHPAPVADRKKFRASILKELGCSDETRLIGYFGGLIERKRPIMFVDIIQKFAERYPLIPIAGLLYGENALDGPDMKAGIRDRAIYHGISDRIFSMGFRQPIEPHMSAVDVMLVPAVSEPFGRTLIESMLLGTPVIATDHGGNPEAIDDGKNGFLVEAENADAFIQPIHALLTNKELMDAISSAARSSAVKNYGVSVHVDKMTSIYEALI